MNKQTRLVFWSIVFLVGCSGADSPTAILTPTPTAIIPVLSPTIVVPTTMLVLPTATTAAANVLDPQTNPCSLLTLAEVSQILGVPAAEIQQMEIPVPKDSNFVMCGFLRAGNQISGINVALYGKGDATKAQASFLQTKDALEKRKRLTPIVDLGDEAFWSGTMLVVRQAPIVFSVAANRSPTEPDLDMSRLAARKILARIP